MKTKSKAKSICALIKGFVILLLIVIQLSIISVSTEAVELCDCDPNLPPMPSIELDTDPCEISPTFPRPIEPGPVPGPVVPGPVVPGPVVPGPVPGPVVPWPDPFDPGKIQPFIQRKPSNCAIIGTSPQMLSWPSVTIATSYNVYLGQSENFSESILKKDNVLDTSLTVEQKLEPGTYYWSVDVVTKDKVYEGIKWMFYVAMKAEDPYPANGIGGVKLPLLQWTSDPNAAFQNVYLGTRDDLTENLVAKQQEDFYFIPFDGWLGPGGEFGLQPNTTYYWRVDEVFVDGTVVVGDVWNFTTEAETPTFGYAEPVAWWSFDENAGPVAKDSVGSRNGDIIGASWLLPAPPSVSTSSALGFDGEYDWVQINDVAGLFDGSFSISCWVSGGDVGQVIFSQQSGANWLMVSRDFPGLQTELTDPALASDAFEVPAGWDHVCIVWDADQEQVVLYVNGERLNSQDGVGDLPVIPDNPLYIGCGSNQDEGSFWNGVIDEVRIFDRALTEQGLNTLFGRDKNIVTDEYYTDLIDLTLSKHVRIDLNYDKALGAVLSQQAVDATDDEITDFANSLGLGVVNIDRPNRIVELELPLASPLSRLQAAEFTRAAREVLDDESLFVEIGLAATPGAAETSILVNEQFTVQLAPDTSIEELIGDGRARIVRQNPYNPDEYLLEITAESDKDAMELANEYHLNSNAVYAVPNLAIVPEFRGNSPVQWQLNDEPNDADIDAQEAWDLIATIFEEFPDVNIAIIDSGFDLNHADLKSNIVFNEPNNSIDHHGTAVAGCIGANGWISGSCPNANLMLLKCNVTTFDQHIKFDTARDLGADVICCSWGYNAEIETPVNVKNAISRATSLGRVRNVELSTGTVEYSFGCVIVFAMSNDTRDNSGDFPDISSLAHVIAVSGSTDKDQSRGAGFGDCMEVLAPTSSDATDSIITTDVTGDEGYNNKHNGECKDLADLDYTLCFGGTSAACATTAGVAGLILSLEPELKITRPDEPYLNWVEVLRLMNDTADKIEDSKAKYSDINGYSEVNTHGFGRVNAYEAVRIMDQNGVDVFLRDHRLDWGNTSRDNNHNHYPEGKPVSTVEFTSKAIEVTETENGVDVSVLVRNRGPITAMGVTVELYACVDGENPPDFSLSANEWQMVEPKTQGDNIVDVPYSGSSVAGLSADPIKTVTFSLSNDSLNAGTGQYVYLLAMAYCDDDPISFDLTKTSDTKVIVADDNNITMLRISRGSAPIIP